MNGSRHESGERLSRRQAAEQLTDLAYALVTDGPLRFDGERRVAAPVADEIVLRCTGTTIGDRVVLQLELDVVDRGFGELSDPRGCQQAQLAGALDRLGAIVHVELRINVAQVRPHRVRRDEQLGRDLRRLQVAGQEPRYP